MAEEPEKPAENEAVQPTPEETDPEVSVPTEEELEALAAQVQAAQVGAGAEVETPAASPAEASAAEAVPADADADADEAVAADTGAAPVEEPAASPPSSAPEAQGPAVLGTKVALEPEAAQPLEVPQFPDQQDEEALRQIDLLDDVELDVKIELGRTQMYIEDVLRLKEGSVVELEKLAGDPVDIYVNERLVARGEVLVLNDNFCVRVNDIVSPVSEVDDTLSA